MSGLLNVGSLIAGIIAWAIPVWQIKKESKDSLLYTILSFSFCAAALCLQLFEINHRVQLNDWSALIDTVPSIAKVAVFLVATTVLLNLIARKVNRES